MRFEAILRLKNKLLNNQFLLKMRENVLGDISRIYLPKGPGSAERPSFFSI